MTISDKTTNGEIKSVYDPKVISKKRLDSARKMLKEKTKIFKDKESSFYAVEASGTDGFYSVNLDKNICNCMDFTRLVEHNDKHECKHIIYAKLLIKSKTEIPTKDLSGLLGDNPN
ncbi:hypothetical protein [Serratia sp. (in: enterobacteria)]|uniref:hypothetical protein n=1 Tax=Serratia sp. (in: enterobacteria) TaxID=616 RepID=UPI00398A2DE3